jgi:D-xylose transport system substrate-binding protein
MNMRGKLALLLAAAMAIGLLGGIGGALAEEKAIKIGISLPTQREERWVLDKEGFEKAAAETGIEISLQIADNDAARQQNQCENLLSQGIDVLIIAPHDVEAAKNIVEMAHAEGVPVISYDRLISNADVDLYVTFDQFRIGQLMGEYLNDNLESGNIVILSGDPADNTCVPLKAGAISAFQEKLDSGAYKVVLEQECRDWEPREALKHMENALTATNNDIQGVIAPNDGTAGGVIQALAAQGLAGKVIVTGQDSETDAIKRIIEGTQSMTVFFDTRDMSAAAFEAAVKMAKGEDSGATGFENNGKIDVPTLQFPASQVTAENYQALLIDSGYMSAEDLN